MTALIRPASGGGWLAVASGRRLLAVAPSDEGFAEAAWTALAATGGFQGALDLLTSGGLVATPSFVLVEWENDGGARVIVRGEVTLTVEDAAGSHDLVGSSVSTWIERTVPGVVALSVVIPGATVASAAQFPLESGVVFAAGVRWSAASAPPADVGVTVTERPEAARPAIDPGEIDAVEIDAVEIEPSKTDFAGTDLAETDLATLRGVAADTMHRSVTEVPDREPTAPAEGDHDGRTVLSSSIAKLRGQRKARPELSLVVPPVEPAPAKLVLVVSTTGAREPLTQPILVGRSPSVSKTPGARIPRLLTLGADQDISRNHVQFALEGGTVVVTDLHSKNGTLVVLPGSTPQKLRAGEPTAVIVGTVVDLGGGITLTVDEDS